MVDQTLLGCAHWYISDIYPSMAHRACGSSDGAEKELSNPMVKLFYGQYLAEGINEGKVFYFLSVPTAHISQFFPLNTLHLSWG